MYKFLFLTKTKGTTKVGNLAKLKGYLSMKATGIVRRIDDLGRVVIPKEIRRTTRIREGNPSHTTLSLFDRFFIAIFNFSKLIEIEKGIHKKK